MWSPVQAAFYILTVGVLVCLAWIYPQDVPLWGGALPWQAMRWLCAYARALWWPACCCMTWKTAPHAACRMMRGRS